MLRLNLQELLLGKGAAFAVALEWSIMNKCHEAAQRVPVRWVPGHGPHLVHFERSVGRRGYLCHGVFSPSGLMRLPFLLRWRAIWRRAIVKGAWITIQIGVVAAVHGSPLHKVACLQVNLPP